MEINTHAATNAAIPGHAVQSDIPSQNLGANDFLRLLTVQLSNQNPLEPLKDTDFISQMSAFSSLEQMKQVNTTLDRFSREQRLVNAQDFLGKTVTYLNANGSEDSLDVDAVTLEHGAILLHGGDRSIPVGKVTGSVLPGAAARA